MKFNWENIIEWLWHFDKLEWHKQDKYNVVQLVRIRNGDVLINIWLNNKENENSKS